MRGVSLYGRRVLITGGGSGIGAETARVLAAAGAEVTLAVRGTDAGERAAEQIRQSTGNPNVLTARLDLADQASVRELADSWRGPLHALVNNAGVMALPTRTLTPDGWELQFATNHLGHFALAVGLHDALAEAGGARIVSVSSDVRHDFPIVFDDISFERRPYDEFSSYGQSKTANALFAVEADRRWAADGIRANALNPGGVHTSLQRHWTEEFAAQIPADFPWKSFGQGASTPVLLAGSPLLEGVGGHFFEDCNEVKAVGDPDALPADNLAASAFDPADAARLWELSLRTVQAGPIVTGRGGSRSAAAGEGS
jgi:NAD(P)-dependent dehydrogenase (short-subunit alcohol dehydrogenase family)